jgi:hypothetical protein
MVDERDEQYDGQEDGEYHFSDDQINYDVESSVSPKMAGSAAAVTSSGDLKSQLLNKLAQHRRTLIGAGIFLVLIVVVYKIVMPSSTAPVTDFTEATPSEVAVATAQSSPKKIEAPLNSVSASAGAQQGAQQSIAPAGMVTAAQPAAAGMPTRAGAPGANAPGVSPQAGQLPSNSNAQQALTPMQQAQAMVASGGDLSVETAGLPQQGMAPPPAPQAQPVMDAQTKNVADRLVALEQQNAAMMNLLQTEYAQKMSDYETQSTAARGKMEEMTKRLNRMESALTQITQLLQGGARQQTSSGMMNVPPQGMGGYPGESAKMAEPKMVYSVQAIIPGRAWLKSESGDTITVAEGDVLRSYGRVTKIDPYDGVVNIDTGNKVITLSYGMNAE